MAGDSWGLGAALNPADANMLAAYNGGAPGARILVGDIGCSTPTGCTRTPVNPPRAGGCNYGALCIPTNVWNLFGPAFRMGARVSSNSWGGGTTSDYVAGSAAIDAFLYDNPDMLVVFAAANSGGGGFYTISAQAVCKNVLSVGALSDGVYGHFGKTKGVPTNTDKDGNAAPLAPLYQTMDGRACGAIVLNAVDQNASSLPLKACPAIPTPLQCYAMAVDGQQNINPPIGGFTAANQYGGDQQIELAACCGCTLKAVVGGCLDPASGAGGAACAVPGALSQLLQGLVNVYNSRWPTVFSSLGPAGDRRIKPDIATPGFEIMSTRSGQYIVPANATAPAFLRNRPYDQWLCPALANFTQAAVFESNLVTVPVSEVVATLALSPLIEPVRIDAVQLSLQSVALPPGETMGWLELWIVHTTEAANQMYPVRQAFPASASPQTVTLRIPGSWHMGSNFAGSIQIYGMPGMTVNISTLATGQPTASATCFTASFANAVQVTLIMARGGANAYTSGMSGTSMATPIMAGMAVLINQYFSDGFFPAGAPTPNAGFIPSASLVKAVLVNSATAAIEDANDRFFGLKLRPRWQLDAQAGFGIPSLPRGLSFTSLGPLLRAAGQLPTLLLPGLVIATGGAPQSPVEPTIMHGQETSYCIDTSMPLGAFPNGGAIALTFTLVWTDPPVSPAAAQQLVNNLDLIVLPPVGPEACGNSGNATAPNQGLDTINNVEVISFASPLATLDAANGNKRLQSAYKVVIRGADVPTPQRYSLVVTGPGVTLTPAADAGCPAVEPLPSVGPTASATSTATATVGAIIGVILACCCFWGAMHVFKCVVCPCFNCCCDRRKRSVGGAGGVTGFSAPSYPINPAAIGAAYVAQTYATTQQQQQQQQQQAAPSSSLTAKWDPSVRHA